MESGLCMYVYAWSIYNVAITYANTRRSFGPTLRKFNTNWD